MNLGRPVVLLAALAIAGCASTMDKAECQAADWRTLGLEDGSRGRGLSHIGTYREACSEHGVTPNLDEYRAGHQEGARLFCTPSNGFAKGRAGASGYENFCPADLAGPFLAEYESGRKVHAAEQRLGRARSALANAIGEIDTLDNAIIDTTALVAAEDTLTVDRVRLAKELVEMTSRRSSLTAERPHLEREVSAAQAAVSRALREAGR